MHRTALLKSVPAAVQPVKSFDSVVTVNVIRFKQIEEMAGWQLCSTYLFSVLPVCFVVMRISKHIYHLLRWSLNK
jgi:hypothetical protein